MARKKTGRTAVVMGVSMPPQMKRQIDDIVELGDPNYPGVSRIVQLALKEWLDKHTEQYEAIDENGEIIHKTRLINERDSASTHRTRRRFEDVMDPFSGMF